MVRQPIPWGVLPILAAAMCIGSGPTQTTPQEVSLEQSALVRSLRWYHRWKAPVEDDVSTDYRCRGLEFSDGERNIYCSPGSVQILLADSLACETLAVRAVLQGSTDVEGALSVARTLKATIGESVSREVSARISASVVEQYETDIQASARFMQGVREWTDWHSRRHKSGRGILLFPLISAEDPFFHVYEIRDGDVTTVYEFAVDCGVVAQSPHWTYDVPHRSLPPGAQFRANDKSRWYRSVDIEPIP